MSVLDAAFWVVSLVLIAAGATKLADPEPLSRALRQLSRSGDAAATSGSGAARLVGAVEVSIGLGSLVVGGAAFAALAALSYCVFTALVVVARRRGLESCGCFGSISARPSVAHVAVNACSAAVCFAAVAAGPPALADGVRASTLHPVAVVAAVLVASIALIFVDTH